MFKIASVVGARPQFVKAGVVSRALVESGNVQEILIHTGQHYDQNMSRVFFEELGLPEPNYNLAVGSASHGAQTGRMLEGIETILLKERPDWVLTYGDTNSTLAASLAATKLHIPTAHVESGLRSYNRRMPEEVNRVIADHISDLLFVPTQAAAQNLAREGIIGDKVRVVGDVMYDAALHYGARVEAHSAVLDENNLRPQQYALVTVHRAENTDERQRMQTIAEALCGLAKELTIVFPIHPRTREALLRYRLLPGLADSITFLEPLGYLDMVALEKNARLIATDSGGVQKEAFFYRVPCVTLRDETEWNELVELGWNRLAPPRDAKTLVAALLSALHAPRGVEANPYGDGHSSQLIAKSLLDCSAEAAPALDSFISFSLK